MTGLETPSSPSKVLHWTLGLQGRLSTRGGNTKDSMNLWGKRITGTGRKNDVNKDQGCLPSSFISYDDTQCFVLQKSLNRGVSTVVDLRRRKIVTKLLSKRPMWRQWVMEFIIKHKKNFNSKDVNRDKGKLFTYIRKGPHYVYTKVCQCTEPLVCSYLLSLYPISVLNDHSHSTVSYWRGRPLKVRTTEDKGSGRGDVQ